MDKKTCLINLRTLQAVALAASNEEARYYLCGVLLEITPQGVTYVATNGHVLLAAHHQYDDTKPNLTASLIVPSTYTRAKLPKRQTDDLVVLEQVSAESYTLGDTRFSPIDGTFPDWRRVVPTEIPAPNDKCVPSQFDPRYVSLFAKAAVKMFVGSPHIMHAADPTSPAIVAFPGTDMFGVLMPRRGGSEWALPTWVRPATNAALGAE